jgi:hypothetical protein
MGGTIAAAAGRPSDYCYHNRILISTVGAITLDVVQAYIANQKGL